MNTDPADQPWMKDRLESAERMISTLVQQSIRQEQGFVFTHRHPWDGPFTEDRHSYRFPATSRSKILPFLDCWSVSSDNTTWYRSMGSKPIQGILTFSGFSAFP